MAVTGESQVSTTKPSLQCLQTIVTRPSIVSMSSVLYDESKGPARQSAGSQVYINCTCCVVSIVYAWFRYLDIPSLLVIIYAESSILLPEIQYATLCRVSSASSLSNNLYSIHTPVSQEKLPGIVFDNYGHDGISRKPMKSAQSRITTISYSIWPSGYRHGQHPIWCLSSWVDNAQARSWNAWFAAYTSAD